METVFITIGTQSYSYNQDTIPGVVAFTVTNLKNEIFSAFHVSLKNYTIVHPYQGQTSRSMLNIHSLTGLGEKEAAFEIIKYLNKLKMAKYYFFVTSINPCRDIQLLDNILKHNKTSFFSTLYGNNLTPKPIDINCIYEGMTTQFNLNRNCLLNEFENHDFKLPEKGVIDVELVSNKLRLDIRATIQSCMKKDPKDKLENYLIPTIEMELFSKWPTEGDIPKPNVYSMDDCLFQTMVQTKVFISMLKD